MHALLHYFTASLQNAGGPSGHLQHLTGNIGAVTTLAACHAGGQAACCNDANAPPTLQGNSGLTG